MNIAAVENYVLNLHKGTNPIIIDRQEIFTFGFNR